MTTIYEQRQAAWREVDLAQAKVHDLDAEIAEDEGRPLSAKWHRLMAEALRSRTPEATALAHEAWLVSMATDHLKAGTVPAEDDHEAAEIEQTMDRIRNLPPAAPVSATTTQPSPGASS